VLHQVKEQLPSNVTHKSSPCFHQNVNGQADLILSSDREKKGCPCQCHPCRTRTWCDGLLLGHVGFSVIIIQLKLNALLQQDTMHMSVRANATDRQLNCFSTTRTHHFLCSERAAYLYRPKRNVIIDFVSVKIIYV
jgi:hypothetical protein